MIGLICGISSFSNIKYMFFFIRFIYCIKYNSDNKIIIALTSDNLNIKNTNKVISSIIDQNVESYLYEILLILPINEFNNMTKLPEYIQILEKCKKIRVLFVRETITNQSKLLIAIKEYKTNPVLIINNKCVLPDGWLKMFIRDHIKYPNDAIAANIQYFFGKNGEIREFSEGFKGEKFGIFNHVTETIFNFALINIDLGGILYPPNFFHNSSFYDQDLFMKIAENSDEFWQSAFIIIEDKVLRQSSKIFDYTRYLIKEPFFDNNYMNRKKFFEKVKLSFSEYFSNFIYSLKKRQNKIIVSITSFPERFSFLPGLMKLLKNQNFHVNKIILFLYKEDYKCYNLNITGIEIILTDKDLRPHKKYFYAMKLFRDSAIITLDDDMYYDKKVFESFFNSYVENPNIISGRRAHLMTYKKNKELKTYFQWRYEQKLIKEPDFNIFLTGCGGIIYPPDILNINDKLLPIIKESITTDDFTLKFLETKKGIPLKWIVNDKNIGLPRKVSKIQLIKVNKIINNICINKLNIMINETIIREICVPYRNIQTGLIIYLFDIHNEYIINNKLYFELIAYSYCPIDKTIKFQIHFDSYLANCFINKSKTIFQFKNEKRNNIKYANCYMNDFDKNLDYYYFPKIISKEIFCIKISNYKKYLTTIFKNFFCKDPINCFLKVILFDKIYHNNFPLIINEKQYFCYIKHYYNDSFNKFPMIQSFKCHFSERHFSIAKNFVSGLPTEKNNNFIDNNIIPNQFIISRIVLDDTNVKKEIIIIGKLVDDIKENISIFKINFLVPHITLVCKLKPFSKYVQSKIYCIHKLKIDTDILIENQIIHSIDNKKELLLINEETMIKIEVNKMHKNDKAHYIYNYKLYKYNSNKNKKNFSFLKFTSILLFIIINIKIIF